MSDSGVDNAVDDIHIKSTQAEYNEELNNLSTQFFDDSSPSKIVELPTDLDRDNISERNIKTPTDTTASTNLDLSAVIVSENTLPQDSKSGVFIVPNELNNEENTHDITITDINSDNIPDNNLILLQTSEQDQLPTDNINDINHDHTNVTDRNTINQIKVDKDDGYTTYDNDHVLIPSQNQNLQYRDKLPLENPASIDKITQHFYNELIKLFSFYAYSQRGCAQQNVVDKTMNQPELVKLLRDLHIYYPEVDLNRIIVSEIYDSCINKSLGIMELDFNRFCQCFIKCCSRAIYKKQYLKRFTTDLELSAALIWILEIENEQLTNVRLKGFPDLVEDDKPNVSDILIRDRLIILAKDCEKPIDQYTPLLKLFPKFSLYGQENINPNQMVLNSQQQIIQNDNSPWGIKERALQKLTLSKLELSKFQFPYQPSYHLPSNQSHRDVVSWDSFRGYSLDKQIQEQQKPNRKTSNDSTDKKKYKKELLDQKPFSPPLMFPPINNPSHLNQQSINNIPIYQQNPSLQMGYQTNIPVKTNVIYPVQYNPVNNQIFQPSNVTYQTMQPNQFSNFDLPNNNSVVMNPSINPSIKQTLVPQHPINSNGQGSTPSTVKPSSQDRYEIAKMNIERERLNRIQSKLASQNK